MSSSVKPMEAELAEAVIYLRRIAGLLAMQSAADAGNRQRVTIDAITSGLTLQQLNNVGTIANEGYRQFEVPARNCYANAIRSKLTFG